MTNPNSVHYPIPSDWQHFERLSIAIMAAIIQKPFHQYGRNGQRQNGVDLYCKHNSTFIAVQCKGRNQGYGNSLVPEDINKAVESLDNFPHKINDFYILTTGKDDTKLTLRAFQLSYSHSTTGSFTVHVLGWQSIENIIRENENIQRKFYRGFFRRYSVKQYFSLVSVVLFSITLCALGAYEYVNHDHEKSVQRKVTSEDIEGFVSLTDKLIKVYNHCDAMMINNILSSSFELKQFFYPAS